MRKEVECPECFTTKTRIIQGEVICTQCGLVIEQVFASSSVIQDIYTDNNIIGGLPVAPKRISLGYIYSRKERQYLSGKKDIELLADYVCLPVIIKSEALQLWKRCVEEKCFVGRNYDLTIISCLYLALLIHKQPVNKFGAFAPIQTIEKTAQRLSEVLNLHLLLPQSTGAKIMMYATRLQLPKDILQEALFLQKRVNIKHKTKHVISLGILYFLAKKHDLKITLLDICRLEESSPESVRLVYRTLRGEKHGKN